MPPLTHRLVASAAAAQSTAITNVTVVDVERGRTVPSQTVILDGRRIVRVGPAASTQPPPGANTIDGRGKFLMPGLWDMHVHTSIPGGEVLLGLYPAFGVTRVRDMNDSFPEVTAWRGRIEAGTLVGPRIRAPSPA